MPHLDGSQIDALERGPERLRGWAAGLVGRLTQERKRKAGRTALNRGERPPVDAIGVGIVQALHDDPWARPAAEEGLCVLPSLDRAARSGCRRAWLIAG